MTPLERAARALYQFEPQTTDVFARDCSRPDSAVSFSQRPASWSDISADERVPFIEKARALLTAIREPSVGMRRAGLEKWYTELRADAAPEAIYTGMLDAALADEG